MSLYQIKRQAFYGLTTGPSFNWSISGSDMPSAIGLVFNKIIELPRLCAFKQKFAQACEAFKI